jgi:hypothetical protein
VNACYERRRAYNDCIPLIFQIVKRFNDEILTSFGPATFLDPRYKELKGMKLPAKVKDTIKMQVKEEMYELLQPLEKKLESAYNAMMAEKEAAERDADDRTALGEEERGTSGGKRNRDNAGRMGFSAMGLGKRYRFKFARGNIQEGKGGDQNEFSSSEDEGDAKILDNNNGMDGNSLVVSEPKEVIRMIVESQFQDYVGTRGPSEFADPLTWWSENVQRLPVVAALAAKFASIPATSASVERLFSVCGIIDCKRRNRTKVDRLCMLVFLKQNWDDHLYGVTPCKIETVFKAKEKALEREGGGPRSLLSVEDASDSDNESEEEEEDDSSSCESSDYSEEEDDG